MTDKNDFSDKLAAGAPPRPARLFPTVGDLFALLGIVLGAQIAAGLASTAVAICMGLDPQTLEPAARGAFMAATYLLAMGSALSLALWYRHVRGGRGPIGRFSGRGLNPALLAWAFVFMLAVSVVCEPVFALLPDPMEVDFGRGIWAMLSVVVVAPVLEELLCRGVALGALRNRYGVVTAWWGSALFFGIMHGDPALAVNALVIGLILGYVYIVTGSLWATMILHALNNALAWLLLTAGCGDTTLSDWLGAWTLPYVLVYAGALAVALLSSLKVRKTLRLLHEGPKNRSGA